MPTTHTVEKGENLSSIAQKHGFQNWRTVYDAPENADFRALRPNPNLIHAGDQLVIPDRTPKRREVVRGNRHGFKLAKPEPLVAQIEIGFFRADAPTQPIPDLDVELLLPPDGAPRAFVTPASGTLSLREPDVVEGTVRVSKIRDRRAEPELNFDRFGGDFLTGHSHVIELPADPVQAALPIVLARSTRRPGFADDGTPARDMLNGDYTKDQILALGTLFELDDFTTDLDSGPPAPFFQNFRTMVTDLFSTGDMEANILRMIDRFEANTGGTYTDPDLDAAVQAHESTGRFENQIRNELRRLINERRGDVSLIQPQDMQLVGRPRYNTNADTIRGLRIAINDTHAFDVDLIEYRLRGGNYTGKFRLTLYDHFGLDQPDVEKRFGMLAGFRSWFILQHLQRFAFRPFITKMVLDYDFSGTVGS